MSLMWHCQLCDQEKGELLPELICDIEKQYDAMREYCAHFNISQYNIGTYKSPYYRYYWVRTEQEYSERFDIQVF